MKKKPKLRELIARAKGGDQEALAQVVDRFQPILKKYSRCFDNDDVYSDFVIWIIGAVKRYRPGTNWGKEELHRFLSHEKSKHKR